MPPPGGEIVKDASGRLTGVLKGAAADLVRRAVTPISFEERLTQVRAVLKEAREGGVTTMQDLTTAPQLMAYQELQRRGELTARIMLRPAALGGRAHGRPRDLARPGRRLAALHRLQGLGGRDHGQQRLAVLRPLRPRQGEQGLPAPHHVPRGRRGRGPAHDRGPALHRLRPGQPGEAARAGGRDRPASARARHRRQGQPHPARRLREGADRARPREQGPPLAGHPRPGRCIPTTSRASAS